MKNQKDGIVDGFDSLFEKVGEIELPEFSGVRIMMLPIIIGETESLPEFVANYRDTFEKMCHALQAIRHLGEVGYLTVDEKVVEKDTTHRRRGLHVDGVYRGGNGGWGGGGWGAIGNGMLTVANPAGCRAYLGRFAGYPGNEGECNHLSNQCDDMFSIVFGANELYWVDGLCVHESLPQLANTKRQFVRLSLPSDGPWFEGYTENPLGIMPTGEILPRREFMD